MRVLFPVIVLAAVIAAIVIKCPSAQASDGCTVDGINYDADGNVAGCEGGGNWCAGAPAQPGICDRTTNTEVPQNVIGQWLYASGVCRGSAFNVRKDKIEYQAAMEPLGIGRIVGVTSKNSGMVTIETILAGDGKFISLWPTDEEGVMAYGYGATAEASSVEKCRVMKTGTAD